MKKLLLILPAADKFRVKSPDMPVPKRKFLRFSLLPLTTIAALTPDSYQITIIDENVEYLDLKFDADIVGITFMTAIAKRAYEIAANFRKRGIAVIAGGYHPTFCTDEVKEHFDAVVVGEAEIHWKQLLEDYKNGELKKVYQSDVLCDEKDIPIPRRDLTIKNEHQYVMVNGIQVGRGCRNSCKYCSITTFHKNKYRSRPIENVIAELEKLPRNIMFIDDNIIADREYARNLFEDMIPLKKRWVSQCSIDIADDKELLKLAKKAGSLGFFIGIESVKQENLANFNKEFNEAKSYSRRIKTIQKAGLLVFASMMVGGDCDQREIFDETKKFLSEINVSGLQLNIVTPLPGTPLFEKYEKAGRIIDYDWDKYDFRHVIFRPKMMSPETLQEGADWLYVQFYRLDKIVFRSIKAILKNGPLAAVILFRLNMTYRYDHKRDKMHRKYDL